VRKRNVAYDKEYLKRWRALNPERSRQAAMRHYNKRKIEINARRRERYANDPERRMKHKIGNLAWYYGISKEQYFKLLAEQGNVCAICKKAPEQIGNKKSLHVDHNHADDSPRGLLCHSCNLAVGFVEENIETLKAMVRYLEKWNASVS
jgi:hypothetical protein